MWFDWVCDRLSNDPWYFSVWMQWWLLCQADERKFNVETRGFLRPLVEAYHWQAIADKISEIIPVTSREGNSVTKDRKKVTSHNIDYIYVSVHCFLRCYLLGLRVVFFSAIFPTSSSLSIYTSSVFSLFQSLDMLKKEVTRLKASPESVVLSTFPVVTFFDNWLPTWR